MRIPPGEIDDIAQEAFLSISIHLNDFEPQRPGSFRRWVRSIVRSKAIDYMRRHRGEAVAVGGTDGPDLLERLPDEDVPDVEAGEVNALCRTALELIEGHFEKRTWTAFWRCTVDGYAPDVVAAELEISAVSVRVAKSRVLACLRRELGAVIS